MSTETEDLTVERNVLKGLVEARDIAKDIFDALPECGGFLSGDGCSAATTTLKIATVAANVVSRVVSISECRLQSFHLRDRYFLTEF